MPSKAALSILVLVLLSSPLAPRAQGMQVPIEYADNAQTHGVQGAVNSASNTPGTQAQDEKRQGEAKTPGNIRGTVVDQSGAIIVGARVRLTREDQSPTQEIVSGDDGQFSFSGVIPGAFQLTISAEGLANRVISGVLRPEEGVIVPDVVMALPTQVTQLTVGVPQVEIAEAQVKDQEKQRVLGFIPNFYVSYVPNAVELTPKQKFELAWKSTIDPVTFVGIGVFSGLEQAGDQYSGYGQGAQGYAKRYGAFYGDVVIGTFIGSAALPSLFKQDPRYFYKGTGSQGSRLLYALGSPFICKGDNGHLQANYSYVLGSFAAGAIGTYYYPASNRNRAQLALETTLFRLGESALSSVLQEFILRKLTPHARTRTPSPP
jgi:Carboxypeptidase regulatory-like domain